VDSRIRVNFPTPTLGVRYLYAEDSRPAEAGASLPPASLAALPEELRRGLADAVVRLKRGPIAAAIGRISNFDSALGNALASYADRFAYTQILDALKSTRGRANPQGA
jgi:hypothetical protein